MARIIDFTQADDKPFGVGTFKLDDGSEHFLDAPDRARDFLQSVGDESRDIASSTLPPTKQQQYDNAVRGLAGVAPVQPGRLDPEKFAPMRRAVAGPGGGEDDASLSSQPEPEKTRSDASDDNMSRPPEDDEATGGTTRSPSEEELRNRVAAQRTANAASLVPTRTGGVSRAQLLARQQQGVPVEKSMTREGGLPAEMYNQQAQDRATAYGYTNDVLAENQKTEQATKLLQHEQLLGEALQQRQANDKQQLALQRKQTQYDEDRKWLEQDVDSFYDKAKPDPDRLFKERGVLGNLATALAQFMGAYASIVSGSPNFASQILDKKIERDVDAQIEDFRRGKMKRDGQLQRMAERGMSLEQMKAGLRLQQEMVIQKEAKAAALAEGSRESMAAYQALMAQRQENFVKDENKFKTEAFGKETTQAEILQPQAARALTPLERIKQTGAVLKAQNDVAYEAGGGAPQEREDIRADKRAEAAAKTGDKSTQRLTDYGNRRGVIEPAAKEAQNARNRLMEIRQKHGGSIPGIGQFDLGATEGLQSLGTAMGSDYMKDAGEVKQLLSIITGAAVRANKGSQTEGDVGREVEALQGPNQTEEQVLKGVERLTLRAMTPLDDLNATYKDVREQWQKQQDDALLERHKKSKEDAQRSRGEEY